MTALVIVLVAIVAAAVGFFFGAAMNQARNEDEHDRTEFINHKKD